MCFLTLTSSEVLQRVFTRQSVLLSLPAIPFCKRNICRSLQNVSMIVFLIAKFCKTNIQSFGKNQDNHNHKCLWPISSHNKALKEDAKSVGGFCLFGFFVWVFFGVVGFVCFKWGLACWLGFLHKSIYLKSQPSTRLRLHMGSVLSVPDKDLRLDTL